MSSKIKYYVMIDVGGTSFKSAILSTEGKVLKESFSVKEIDEKSNFEEIIENIIILLREKIAQIKEYGELEGIGFGFPGPFDYKKGISLMRHKYRGIYKINLKKEIINSLGLPQSFPLIFQEDSTAFLKGETWMGNATNFKRVIGITLGEGLGTAFMVDGKIIKDSPIVPPNGELWCLHYNEGIIEDKISRRGIIQIYRKISGDLKETDVKNIDLQARSGNINAIQTFKEFGKDMGCLLKPYIKRFKGECMVIGGQIAKGYDLFAESLREELIDTPSLKKITPAKFIDLSVFFGLLKCFSEKQLSEN